MKGNYLNNLKILLLPLLEEGKSFNYNNVGNTCQTGIYGNLTVIDHFAANWTVWKSRTTRLLADNFESDSSVGVLLHDARSSLRYSVSQEHFNNGHQKLIAALTKAIEATTDDIFGEIKKQGSAIAPSSLSKKVFIVHGHDELSKSQLENMLIEFGLEPIVLHRQRDAGRTIIEKFEAHADVGYAFILFTPDEIAYLAADEQKIEAERKKELRARPNVIFEFGFFVGKLSRERTCCLLKGNIERPSDLDGMIYKKFEKNVEEVGLSIRKELLGIGYTLAS